MVSLNEALSAAWGHFRGGDLAAAERGYRAIVQGDPRAAHAWYMLGAVQHLQGRLVEAAANYREALWLVPDFPEAQNNLGNALRALGDPDAAIAVLERALALRPEDPEAHNNLGNALCERGELETALAHYQKAVALRPEFAEAWHNRGNALRGLGRLAEAVEHYEQALRHAPESPEIHLGRALAWLQAGDFERGWPEHEWRLKCRRFAPPTLERPVWDGRPLDGRTLLLYAEHGLGNALQFIRYAPRARERCGRTVLACPPPLGRLLATCPGVDQVVVDADGPLEFDAYAPLMGLPRIFGTTIDAVPRAVPYLHPDAALVKLWSKRLPAASEALRIGVAWQGNPGNARDRWRSFHPGLFEPIARRPDVRLFSLQKGHGRERLDEVRGRFAVTDLADDLDDLMDTAALLKNLDLVIVPDTALAHLAGALGVPAWAALPFAADWRWGVDRGDCPWYPSLRLFRQSRWGDWNEVFERVAKALTAR